MVAYRNPPHIFPEDEDPMKMMASPEEVSVFQPDQVHLSQEQLDSTLYWQRHMASTLAERLDFLAGICFHVRFRSPWEIITAWRW